MKRIAYIQNNYIVNVSIAEDDYILAKDGTQMLESYAIEQGYTWESIESSFEELVKNGFNVQPENITLGLSENDRNSFSQMLSLVKEALDLGLITNDSPQIISDINGEKHQISTLRFRQIMVQYGFYYKNLWDQRS